ncbi:MAG: sulfite exporter TauE/SafE family protein [bacterium]
MMRIIIEGFSLGLATGGFCLGACAPIFIPFMLTKGKTTYKKLNWDIVQFLLGRFIAYIMFALAASWISQEFANVITRKFIGYSIVITAVILLIYGLVKNFPNFQICKTLDKNAFSKNIPFAFGFLIGINICPPFLVGLARIADLGNILGSTVFFSSFFIGTSLYMFPLILLKPVLKYEKIKTIGQITSLLAGIYFLMIGIIKII